MIVVGKCTAVHFVKPTRVCYTVYVGAKSEYDAMLIGLQPHAR